MKSHILILSVFILLTILLTYPMVFQMSEAVKEPGDSLFNTWTVYWVIHALLTDPLNVFNANNFYPYRYTFAYSEHMIGVGLIALPVYFFTKNPLLIHNLMLLLSFVLCGWGGYLLGHYLTKDRIAGIVSGIIFAFCPFRFAQSGHLQVLTSQWIPLSLLFLHKYIDIKPKRLIHIFLFGFFFFLQSLSSGHNGLYLTLTVCLFLLYFRKEAGLLPWLMVILISILLIPFYYPYMHLSREFGFSRPLYEFELYSPHPSSYLAVPSGNWIYGKIFSRFGGPEAVMFPGVMALMLGFWRKIPGVRVRLKISVINIFILLDIILIILLIKTGGIDLGRSIFGVKLKVTDFTRPVNILVILIILKIGIKRIINLFRSLASNKGPVQFYWILAILMFLFSFGPEIRTVDKEIMWGPYSLLYNFFPGFKGLRVSGRIYTVFIMSLGILAGFGVKRLRPHLRKFSFLTLFIPVIVLAEYINIPFNLGCRIGTDPAPVYKKLNELKKDAVVIELPMPDWYSQFSHEIEYLYWSVFHWRRLVNGYSGYSPPTYWVISEKIKYFPTDDTVEMLKILNVDYVIVHNTELSSWGWPDVIVKMGNHRDIFKLRYSDENDYIYELIDKKVSIPEEELHETIDKKEWTIETNRNAKDAHKVMDSNLTTRWHTDSTQKAGMFIEIDMAEIYRIEALSMDFGKASMDFPRGLKLEISEDKNNWCEIDLRFNYANYVRHLLKYPKDKRMIIRFNPVDAGFARLTLTADHGMFFWSIYELDIWGAKDTRRDE